MGTMLDALRKVQSIERQVAHVRGRLQVRENAVAAQQKRIEQLREDWQVLHDRSRTRRSDADRVELDLKEKEDKVSKLRSSLNTAKTNKEYAAVLTQINTLKADNAKLEEDALRIMQDADALKSEAAQVQAKITQEDQRLQDIQKTSQDEVAKLRAMLAELTAQRLEAAKAVPADKLAVFDRIADSYEGEGMAVVEIHGTKTPYTYICGGCYMTLTAEHANALRVRDEIRTCDNCGRILYLERQDEKSPR
jgi:predicted  nucleic acid-binding Zn-ribbon protein